MDLRTKYELLQFQWGETATKLSEEPSVAVQFNEFSSTYDNEFEIISTTLNVHEKNDLVFETLTVMIKWLINYC